MADKGMAEALGIVVAALEATEIGYAVTGSVASSIHGEPITSLGIDIVAQASADQAGLLADRLRPRFYADRGMLQDAAAGHSMANVYDQLTGMKFDISVLAETPYHNMVMQRRVRVTDATTGLAFQVVSAEDVILMKLVWRRDSLSAKQWGNALSVARVRRGSLDWEYLRKWAIELGVEPDLDRLAREAGI